VASSLKRVLRIRALREDLSRMELEAEAARLRHIDLAATEAASEARTSREQSFRELQGRELRGEARGSGAPKKDTTPDQAGSANSDGGESGNQGNRRNEGWRAAEAAWERAVWRQSGCERLRPEQQGRVDRAHGDFLADRRDRLQAETLVEEAAALERADQARRDQRGLDDWFQSWAKRVRREEKG